MVEFTRPRVVGFNHVALEVGDIDEALAFYGRLFRFELRGRSDSMAFIDLGDQLSPFRRAAGQLADDGRHFGLVVDDKEAARKALEAADVTLLDGPFLDFRDPWGNRVEIVGYDNIQFTKAPNVLRGMSVAKLFNSSKQADTTHEILIPTVGPKGIEGGPHEDGGVEARLIGLFQPPHRLVMIA